VSGTGLLESNQTQIVACHECDLLHDRLPVPGGGVASCSRCGSMLYKSVPNSLNRSLALYLAALVCLALANTYPFLSLKLSGRMEENLLISGSVALWKAGMGELGLLVFLTSILFPAITIIGMLYILVPVRFNRRPPGMSMVFRFVKTTIPWSLLGVFMLGVLVSFVKLMDLATVIPGVSLFSFVALMVFSVAAYSNLDESLLWPRTAHPAVEAGRGETALEQGFATCHVCSMLVPYTSDATHAHSTCQRCNNLVHPRKNNSITRSWALICAALLLLIPANLYPVMTVIRFGQGEPNTIMSGVIHLIESGMWGLALIVFFASIVIPFLKLSVLIWLMVMVQKKSSWRPHDRTRLYRVTEVVGAWSMVDIYVIAVLVALVNLDALATIKPGVGAVYFAAAVISTIFAANSFDPRLIWDNRTS